MFELIFDNNICCIHLPPRNPLVQPVTFFVCSFGDLCQTKNAQYNYSFRYPEFPNEKNLAHHVPRITVCLMSRHQTEQIRYNNKTELLNKTNPIHTSAGSACNAMRYDKLDECE